MSDISSMYGDFGLAAAGAIRKRKRESIANTQAAMLGQKRGARNVTDIQTKYREGFQPLTSSFGRRGLGGPNVSSGIRTAGLEKYAQNLQKELGIESERFQDEMAGLAMNETAGQQELESYLNDLKMAKQQQILSSALDIKQLASY